jgi:hypothetical protein
MSKHCDQAAQIFDGQFLTAKSARSAAWGNKIGAVRGPGCGGLRSWYAQGEGSGLEGDPASTVSSMSRGNNFSRVHVFISSYAGTLPGM